MAESLSSNNKNEPMKKSTRNRPFGVTVIVLLMLFNILSAVLFTYAGYTGQLSQLLELIRGSLLPVYLNILSVPILIPIAIGLWLMRHWAWLATMIVIGINMAVSIWLYTIGEPGYLQMLSSVIVVFYLNQSEVQQAFAHGSKHQENTWTP